MLFLAGGDCAEDIGEHLKSDFLQFIPCEKYDSKKSYKMEPGYFPGVSTMGKHIVHIENRNGNTNVKYQQADTLKNAYCLLEQKGIKINRSRMDCGSFSKEIISLVEVCSINYTPFKGDKTYRYVVSREPNKTGQTDIEFQDSFIYRAILTNDKNSSDKEVVEYYNQRGATEKIFDEMNNDFGWKKLPFSFLEQNTVFMLVMAMCRNFYLYLLTVFSLKVSFVKTTYKLKKLIFRFVVVPFKWIRRSRQNFLKLYTKKEYPMLIETFNFLMKMKFFGVLYLQ